MELSKVKYMLPPVDGCSNEPEHGRNSHIIENVISTSRAVLEYRVQSCGQSASGSLINTLSQKIKRVREHLDPRDSGTA